MAITKFSPPSAEQILSQLISNYSAITTANGFSVGVNPGSEIYTRFSALAQQQAVFYQIMLQQMDARMADTATGSDLDRVLNQFGLTRKPATAAEGFVQLIGQAPQSLSAGMLLNGPNGLQYQVSVSGIYQPANSAAAIANVLLSYVPVIAVNQGVNTDLGIGQVMTWININSLMQSTTPVAVALTGGSDAETDEQARFRLYQVLQSPPNAGNVQFLINLASTIDPIVQSGFVYPDYNGAGTQMISLVGYQSDGYYIGRDIPHLPSDNANLGGYNNLSFNAGSNLVNDTSAILGQLPAIVANQYASVITTVENMAVDLSIGLNLPYPVGNPINGIGGGWINNTGQTWPVLVPGQPGIALVGSVQSSTDITVNSYSTTSGVDAVYDPIPGLTTIQWVDRSGGSNKGWRIITSVVTKQISKTGPVGGVYSYRIQLSVPLVCGITTSGQTDFYGESSVSISDPIMPASINAQNYLNTVMNSFASLGPGEVVVASSLLRQLGANRQPAPGSVYPSIVGAQFFQSLTNNNPEIYQATQLYNSSTNAILNYNAPYPPVSQPPTIFIPEIIAFYDLNRVP